jgi:hypothetical protein
MTYPGYGLLAGGFIAALAIMTGLDLAEEFASAELTQWDR